MNTKIIAALWRLFQDLTFGEMGELACKVQDAVHEIRRAKISAAGPKPTAKKNHKRMVWCPIPKWTK